MTHPTKAPDRKNVAGMRRTGWSIHAAARAAAAASTATTLANEPNGPRWVMPSSGTAAANATTVQRATLRMVIGSRNSGVACVMGASSTAGAGPGPDVVDRPPHQSTRRALTRPLLRLRARPPVLSRHWTAGPPDWVGVGVQRAGTSWWQSLLEAHPDVHGRGWPDKELHFFDRFEH